MSHFHGRHKHRGGESHASHSREHQNSHHHHLLHEFHQNAVQHSRQNVSLQNTEVAFSGKDVPLVSAADNDDPQIKALGQTLASYAEDEAAAIHTVGDCARGPRRTFERIGLHLPVVIATEQRAAVQNSGLFDEVPRQLVRPGDYGVRDWNNSVTRAHGGVNKGDSFIVTKVDSSGRLYGANDHFDWVPEDGDRYRNMHFYRFNQRFMRLRGYFAPAGSIDDNSV